MTIRELTRPLPGVRQISLLRQRIGYGDRAGSSAGFLGCGRS